MPYESPQPTCQNPAKDRTEHWPDRASYDLVLGADVVYLEVPLLRSNMLSRDQSCLKLLTGSICF